MQSTAMLPRFPMAVGLVDFGPKSTAMELARSANSDNLRHRALPMDANHQLIPRWNSISPLSRQIKIRGMTSVWWTVTAFP